MRCRGPLIAVVFLLSAGVIAVPAQAIVVRNTQDDSLYRSLGSSSPYDSVGRFTGTTNNSCFLASGTLIAPDWVLTAAHVVDNAKNLTFSIGGEVYQVDRKVVYPGWNGDLWAGCDIGMVHLAKPVDNVKPAQLYTGCGELNHADTVVGFGKTGTGLIGDTTSDGVKRRRKTLSPKSTTNVCFWPISANLSRPVRYRWVFRMPYPWRVSSPLATVAAVCSSRRPPASFWPE